MERNKSKCEGVVVKGKSVHSKVNVSAAGRYRDEAAILLIVKQAQRDRYQAISRSGTAKFKLISPSVRQPGQRNGARTVRARKVWVEEEKEKRRIWSRKQGNSLVCFSLPSPSALMLMSRDSALHSLWYSPRMTALLIHQFEVSHRPLWSARYYNHLRSLGDHR